MYVQVHGGTLGLLGTVVFLDLLESLDVLDGLDLKVRPYIHR